MVQSLEADRPQNMKFNHLILVRRKPRHREYERLSHSHTKGLGVTGPQTRALTIIAQAQSTLWGRKSA